MPLTIKTKSGTLRTASIPNRVKVITSSPDVHGSITVTMEPEIAVMLAAKLLHSAANARCQERIPLSSPAAQEDLLKTVQIALSMLHRWDGLVVPGVARA